MFGGLELKGGTPERKEKAEGNPVAGPAASSFSFLNAGTASNPAAAGGGPPPGQQPAASGFSFLATAAPPPTAAPPAEVTVPSSVPAAAAGGSTSVFDFMVTASTTSPPSAIPNHRARSVSHESVEEGDRGGPIPGVAATSSFSFLDGIGGTTSSLQQHHPTATATADLSSVVSGLSRDPSFELPPSSSPPPPTMSKTMPEQPSSLSIPLPSTSLAPTGAGITFGGGVTGQPQSRVVKKRNRTARVGAAANPTATTAATPSVLPDPPIPSTTTGSASSLPPRGAPPDTAGATRESAVEASRRADEFMSAKLKEQAKNSVQFQPVGSESSSSSSVRDEDDGVTAEVLDDDSIVAAARAAAEEAQQLSHKQQQLQQQHHQHGRPASSYFGSLFRSRASPPAGESGGGGLSYSSNHNSSSGHLHSAHNSPAGAALGKQVVSAVDRLQREQEESKRAAAERQFRMMQQQQQQNRPQEPQQVPPKPPVPAPEKASVAKRTPSYTQPSSVEKPPVDIPGPPSLKKAVSAPAPKFPVLAASSSGGVAQTSTPPPPAQPQPKAPSQVFQAMQQTFRDQVVAAMTQVTKLRQHRSGLLEERFVTLAKERLATQQRSHAESQQTLAAEHEDFETADKMSHLIDAHERERVEFAAVLENIQLALKQLEDQKQQVVEGVTKCFLEMEHRLREFQQEQESKESQDDAESMRVFSTLSKQLSVENERLQHDLKHIERDAELVAEERKELETAISEQAGEFERLRDECTGKLKQVENEIEELRRLLQEKQRVAAQLRTEAAGHDESVLKVRVKFSRQLQRVQKKESTIKDNREEWELEKKAYEAHREEHEAKVRQHSEALLAREHLLESLGKELEMVTTFEEIVAKEIGMGIMADANVDGDLAQLQADVVKTEAAVAEAKELFKVVASALTSLEQEVEGLEARLPILEQIKTDAAARRDFKGAGKASKEIKEATARLKECKEELLEEAVERQRTAEEEVKKREQELQAKRAVAQEQEREQSAVAMQQLADNIRRLLATKASVCGDAKPDSIQGVGAYVLDSQIAALQYEGETYGEKYGGWDELMAEIGLEKTSPIASDEVAAAEEADEAKDSTSDTPADDEEVADQEQPDDAPSESLQGDDKPPSKDEALAKYRDLLKRLKVTEEAIETAVTEENFEEADKLDQVLQDIMAEVESLNLTDEDMEGVALSDSEAGDGTGAAAETEDQDEPPSEEDVNATDTQLEEAQESPNKDDVVVEPPEAEDGGEDAQPDVTEDAMVDVQDEPDHGEASGDATTPEDAPAVLSDDHNVEGSQDAPLTNGNGDHHHDVNSNGDAAVAPTNKDSDGEEDTAAVATSVVDGDADDDDDL